MATKRDGRVALTLSVAVDVALAALDLFQGSDVVFVGLLAIGPFLAAAFTSPVQTALAGVAAVLLGVALVLLQASFGEASYLVRLAGLVVASLLALFVADRRQSREQTVLRLRRITEGVQEALLRPVPSELGSLRCAGRYLSAATETMLGGDFHDVLPTRFGVRVVVGDVRGKGIEAIRLAASMLGRFRELALSEPQLTEVGRSMDRVIAAAGDEEDFATVLLLEFHDEEVVVNCGHHPPLRAAPSGCVEALEDGDALGLPLGFGDPGLPSRFVFGAGERIVAYTDGMVEARDAAARSSSSPTTFRVPGASRPSGPSTI